MSAEIATDKPSKLESRTSWPSLWKRQAQECERNLTAHTGTRWEAALIIANTITVFHSFGTPENLAQMFYEKMPMTTRLKALDEVGEHKDEPFKITPRSAIMSALVNVIGLKESEATNYRRYDAASRRRKSPS
ncbi:MAG: hypothetical protein U0174_23115 [Polyangiaceae bacterium]